jgi:dTDP-glucose 4,6-dehydratase
VSGKTYCILGGGGAFGIHTAFYLLEHANPKKVIGIGRNPLRPEPFSLGIDRVAGFEYRAFHVTYELDLLLEYLDREKPEVIINFAAQGEGAVSWKHSWRFFETNAMALTRLAEELGKRDWLERFIQIGTSEMYGSTALPASEDAPIRPSSPYAASKVAFDLYLMSAHRYLGFPMNIIRPSNAYCPGQLLHRVIPKAIWCWLNHSKVPLHGGGNAQKSYLHARDLAAAILLVADQAPTGAIYNVAPATPVSIKYVMEQLAWYMNINFDQLCAVADDRLGQDARYWLDSTAIRDLGWGQTVLFEHGLPEMIKWGRKYGEQIKALDPGYILRG